MQTERQKFLSEEANRWGLEYHQVETFWNESKTGKEFYKKIKECVRLKRLAKMEGKNKEEYTQEEKDWMEHEAHQERVIMQQHYQNQQI